MLHVARYISHITATLLPPSPSLSPLGVRSSASPPLRFPPPPPRRKTSEMSKFYHILPATTDRSSSPIIKSRPSPDTTVAINLRFFEEESKSQAEREYDAQYGANQAPSACDVHSRFTQKKRRKVRSAIVSRRKSALYEKKLEEELEMRDSVNERLKNRLNDYNTQLIDIRNKIQLLEKELDSSHSPLPSFRCIQKHAHSMSVSPTKCLRLPGIHSQNLPSQISFSAAAPSL